MDASEDLREDELLTGTERELDWWHRDHPTFFALSGFFTGVAYVALIPTLFFVVLRLVADTETAEQSYGWVVLSLVVPLLLVAVPRTRRFGLYMLLGVVLAALVVVGVASLLLYLLVQVDG
ncbi:MAG: hypothetical protein ACI379_17095 [Nocardioides sp.]|uniref:hypothetical protein n=1 Tax=Nocardioides sp. TaxID=35761 RepID=UPI003F107571